MQIDDFDFLCEIWTMFDENSDWIVIDFVLNLVKLFSTLSTCGHFIFDTQTCCLSVYFFCMLTTVFFWILDENFFFKLRNAINKIRVAASFFFSNLFLCLSQLSQATLRPELLNFVQKLCPFKRLIYDLIHEWRSFGGVKTDID